MLPHLEQGNLFQRWDDRDHAKNIAGGPQAVTAQVLEALRCPSDPMPGPVYHLVQLPPEFAWVQGYYGIGSYGGNAGTRGFPPGAAPAYPTMSKDGLFYTGSEVRLQEITDGVSNTLLLGERVHHDPEFDRVTGSRSPQDTRSRAGGHGPRWYSPAVRAT